MLTFILPQWRLYRRRLLWCVTGMAGGSLLMSLLKHGSALHCPWDLAEYGGYAPSWLVRQAASRDCGGALFSRRACFWRICAHGVLLCVGATHARAARVCLMAGVAAGMVRGGAQMMRGAHFLSHTVWSGWVVWVFLVVFYKMFPPFGECYECRIS